MTPDDRESVSLEYRNGENGPAFRVIDGRLQEPNLARAALAREQVIGTELAPVVFALVDAIWMKDRRISEIQSWS